MPTAPVPIRYQVFPEPGHVTQVAVSVGDSKVPRLSKIIVSYVNNTFPEPGHVTKVAVSEADSKAHAVPYVLCQ